MKHETNFVKKNNKNCILFKKKERAYLKMKRNKYLIKESYNYIQENKRYFVKIRI